MNFLIKSKFNLFPTWKALSHFQAKEQSSSRKQNIRDSQVYWKSWGKEILTSFQFAWYSKVHSLMLKDVDEFRVCKVLVGQNAAGYARFCWHITAFFLATCLGKQAKNENLISIIWSRNKKNYFLGEIFVDIPVIVDMILNYIVNFNLFNI